MRSQYWFYIEPYVHIAIKKDGVLLYNSYTGKILEYYFTPLVLKLAKRLHVPRNLRVILLTESDLEQPAIREFIAEIRGYFMGDLIDTSHSAGKPIQMPPIVKIQKDVKYLKVDSSRSVGEDLMYYLSEVSLYLNDSCHQNCSICAGAYRQFSCCTKKMKRNLELNIDHLGNFLEEIKNISLVRMNILGGDICMYSNFEKLFNQINSLQTESTFYLHYKNAAVHKDRLKIMAASNSRLNIPITFPIDEEKLKIVLEIVNGTELKTNIMFIIQCKTDFEMAETSISKFKIEKPYFIPFYNGSNLNLFKDNIYIDRDDLEENRISIEEIYARGSVNSLNFGRLTIFPDGSVYANVNYSCLGHLGQQSIYDIIYKEMNNGKSWRKIRKNVLPCKRCTFEELCPPISNYNIVIGRYNLCHIWKDEENSKKGPVRAIV